MICPHCHSTLANESFTKQSDGALVTARYCTNHRCPARKPRGWLPDERYARYTVKEPQPLPPDIIDHFDKLNEAIVWDPLPAYPRLPRCSRCSSYGGLILDNTRFCLHHAYAYFDEKDAAERASWSWWERFLNWLTC